MSQLRLLIVHPDGSIRALMSSMLGSLGHRIDEAEHERAAVRQLEQHPTDLILLDCDPKPGDAELDPEAIDFLSLVRRKYPRSRVVLFGSPGRSDRPREAMLRGVGAVLRFPMPATQLRAAVAQALEEAPPSRLPQPLLNAAAPGHGLTPAEPRGDGRAAAGACGPVHGHANGAAGNPTEVEATHRPPAPRTNHPAPAGGLTDEALGEDPTIRQLLELAQGIAQGRSPVLLVGERGTGKSVLARRIHQLGPQARGPFVVASCATQSEAALEAELFGRRALAPGESDRPGQVAQAAGGTLYLDEVTALSPPLQYRLLRLIRSGEYEATDSIHTERADCRLIVGTQDDLPALVEAEQFRLDLYYALGLVSLKLPPLRHRPSDIVRLAEQYREQFARDLGRGTIRFSPQALTQLQEYDWPGNLLELKAVVERAIVYCRSALIEPGHLALNGQEIPGPLPTHTRSRPRPTPKGGIQPLKEALEGPERQLILEALQALNWNRQETARVLDINRTTLYKKMKKYGLLYDEPIWAN